MSNQSLGQFINRIKSTGNTNNILKLISSHPKLIASLKQYHGITIKDNKPYEDNQICSIASLKSNLLEDIHDFLFPRKFGDYFDPMSPAYHQLSTVKVDSYAINASHQLSTLDTDFSPSNSMSKEDNKNTSNSSSAIKNRLSRNSKIIDQNTNDLINQYLFSTTSQSDMNEKQSNSDDNSVSQKSSSIPSSSPTLFNSISTEMSGASDEDSQSSSISSNSSLSSNSSVDSDSDSDSDSDNDSSNNSKVDLSITSNSSSSSSQSSSTSVSIQAPKKNVKNSQNSNNHLSSDEQKAINGTSPFL